MCNLYEGSYESSKHFIFQCPFSIRIWNWIKYLFNCVINLISINELFSFITTSWSKHMQDITLAVATFVSGPIWHYKNNKRFNNKVVSFHLVIALIIGKTRIICNASSACMNSSIQQFVIRKQLGILDHHRRANHNSSITWTPFARMG